MMGYAPPRPPSGPQKGYDSVIVPRCRILEPTSRQPRARLSLAGGLVGLGSKRQVLTNIYRRRSWPLLRCDFCAFFSVCRELSGAQRSARDYAQGMAVSDRQSETGQICTVCGPTAARCLSVLGFANLVQKWSSVVVSCERWPNSACGTGSPLPETVPS